MLLVVGFGVTSETVTVTSSNKQTWQPHFVNKCSDGNVLSYCKVFGGYEV